MEAEDSERVDVAIADALKAQKNRQTGKEHIRTTLLIAIYLNVRERIY